MGIGIIQIAIIIFYVFLFMCFLAVGLWFLRSKKIFDEKGKIKDVKEYYKRLGATIHLAVLIIALSALLGTIYWSPAVYLTNRIVKTTETAVPNKNAKIINLYPIMNDDIYVLSYGDDLFYLTENGMQKIDNQYNTDFDAADEYIEEYVVRKKAYLAKDTKEKWPLYVWPKSESYRVHLRCTEELSFLNTP